MPSILTHILQARKPNLNEIFGAIVSEPEGLIGRLFPAIIIVRLVGLEIGHRVRRNDE